MATIHDGQDNQTSAKDEFKIGLLILGFGALIGTWLARTPARYPTRTANFAGTEDLGMSEPGPMSAHNSDLNRPEVPNSSNEEDLSKRNPRWWSFVTNIGFLTLLIALGTLATAVVGFTNEQATQQQISLLKEQVGFNAAESRPFLRLEPKISNDQETEVYLMEVNLGKIPARVISTGIYVQVGREVVQPTAKVLNTGDIIYENRPGAGVAEKLTSEESSSFLEGTDPVIVAGCAIYSSITSDDSRRWKVFTVYRFADTGSLPVSLLTDEISVSPKSESCDANRLREEWLKRIGATRK